MNQISSGAPDEPAPRDQGHDRHCKNGELLVILAKKLESRGLDSRLVTYPAAGPADGHVVEIVVTNPAAPQRGEIRIGDDGGLTWEYFGETDEAGISNILDDATNALRATGLRRDRTTHGTARPEPPGPTGPQPRTLTPDGTGTATAHDLTSGRVHPADDPARAARHAITQTRT